MTTRWSPDTCDCVLDVDPTWTSCTVVSKCAIHSAVLDANIFTTVYTNENKKKNELCQYIVDTYPAVVSENPSTTNEFMAAYGIEGELVFDVDRVIQVDIPALSPSEKSDLQAAVDGMFNPGDVEVAM